MITLPAHQGLRRLLIAQLPADFADWLDYVAIISLFTYVWSVDPMYFAGFAVAFSAPYLIVGPIAGALVDRHDLKTIMIWSNLGRALTTFGLAFAGMPETVLVLVFVRSVTDSFFSPAKQAAIQTMAEKSELMATNSLSQVINQTSKLLGPAVGGGLLLFVSSQMVFVVNGFVSLIAMAILFSLPKTIRAMPEKGASAEESGAAPKKNMLKEIAEGYQTVGRKPALWFTILLGAVGFFAVFLHDTLLGPVTKLLGFDQSVLGLSITAVGAGGVLGALTLGAIKKQVHPYFYIGPAVTLSACFTIWLGYVALNGWVIPSWFFIAAFFTVGIFGSGIFVPLRTAIQLETPPEQMGRVTAVNDAATVLAMMGAPFIGAFIAREYGLGMPFMVGGSISLVLGIVTLLVIPFIKFNLEDNGEDQAPDLSKAV